MNKKKTYRIRNWKNYNKALVKRGSLTLYFDENAINNRHNRDEPNNKRGRPKEYTDTAITCMLTIRAVFDLPLRATQGLTMYSKRRTWRKLHLGINEQTKEIIAAALTTNNVSDG